MSSQPSRSSELAARFPGAHKLAYSYVTNSWDYLFGTPEAAVEAFMTDQPELIESAADGIDELLSSCADEPEREAVLDEWGWGYGGEPGVLDEFLIWTRATLRRQSD